MRTTDGALTSVVTGHRTVTMQTATMRADMGDMHRTRTPATGHHGAGSKTVYGDGSWQLTIFVTDLQVERSLRVRGDLHIGGVMIQLVDSLG